MHSILSTRRTFTAALSPQRLRRWWRTTLWSSTTAEKLDSAGSLSSQKTVERLPDAVLDAWLSWRRQQRGCGDYDALFSWPSAAEVLSRVPCSEIIQASGLDKDMANGEDAVAKYTNEVAELPFTTLGALCDAILNDSACRSADTFPSRMPLEAVFAHLCAFTPLFIRLNSYPAHTAVLVAYCNDVKKEATSIKSSGEGNPYMRHVLRQALVSWQPWVAPTQAKRLIAGFLFPYVLQRNMPLSTTASAVNDYTDKQPYQTSSTWPLPELILRETEQEGSWRILLENVPGHYVSAELVRAEVKRKYPLEGLNFWATWVRKGTVAPRRAFSEDRAGPLLTTASSQHRFLVDNSNIDPFLEVTADGRAVRAPSKEACLQSGCPARVAYRSGSSVSGSLQGKYSLLQHTHCGSLLVHSAAALLATVISTRFTDVSIVRDLFSERRDSAEREQRIRARPDEFGGRQSANSLSLSKSIGFFPCVETLLDHPDLAFAIQIRDATRDFDHLGLPCSSVEQQHLHQTTLMSDALQVWLHPAFAHELRGVADVTLNALRHKMSLCNVPALSASRPHCNASSFVGSPRVPTHVLHVHYLNRLDDIVASSLLSLLQFFRRAETADDLVSTNEVDAKSKTNESLPTKTVVCLSCFRCDCSATQSANGAETTEGSLLFAITHKPNRVDAVVVAGACRTALYERISTHTTQIATSSPAPRLSEEKQDGDVPRIINAFARLLCDNNVVKLIPFQFFSNSVQQRNELTRLFDALPDCALSSLCTLQHIACYTGQPMGDGIIKSRQEAELLLSAVTNYRNKVRIEWAEDQTECSTNSESDRTCEALRGISDAARLAVAALLMWRCRQAEERQSVFLVCHPLSASAGSAGQQKMSFPEALKIWTGSPHSMYDYNVVMRLARYACWLWNVVGLPPFACVEDIIDEEAKQQPFSSYAELSPAAAREALRELVAAYGPEPFPEMIESWHIATVSDGVARKPAKENVKRNSEDISPRNVTPEAHLPNDNGAAVLSVKDGAHGFIDAGLYDALLRDAAAVQQRVTMAPASPFNLTGTHSEAGQVEVPDEDRQRNAVGSVSSEDLRIEDPFSAALAAGSDSKSHHEQDTLQFYLSTVLVDDAPAAATGTPPLPSNLARKHTPVSGPARAEFTTATVQQVSASNVSALQPGGFSSSSANRHLALPAVPRGFFFGPRCTSQLPQECNPVDQAKLTFGSGSPLLMPPQVDSQPTFGRLPSRYLRQQKFDGSRSGEPSSVPPTVTFANSPHFPSSRLLTTATTPPLPLSLSHRGVVSPVACFDHPLPWANAGDPGRNACVRGHLATAFESVQSTASTLPRTPLSPPVPPSPPPPVPSVVGFASAGSSAPSSSENIARVTAGFLGKSSDSERLRLASLIVDILRGSSSSNSQQYNRDDRGKKENR